MDALVGSRDEFLALVSHDLGNMLGNVALGAAALLRLDEGNALDRAAIDRVARTIQRSVGRMHRVVGDLLDVVSLEAGRLAVAPARHDTKDLLHETVDVFRPLADAKSITITHDVRGGSLVAGYDYERILQVLGNLVGNAIKCTGHGGHIDLVVEALGDEVCFTVRDNGIGIDSDKLGVIFERFWQLDRSRRAGLGLGLGLYISKCIVEAHGGRIWAQSQPGAGSTFSFTLPAGPASAPNLPDR